MSPLQNIYMAAGQLAYAMAVADGNLAESEKKTFREMVMGTLQPLDTDFSITEIIFHVMQKEKADAETAYRQAIHALKLNSHYLSPQLKVSLVRLMEKVAEAWLPVEAKERELLGRFKNELTGLRGDHVFYEKTK